MAKESVKQRNLNIEVLRIIAMFLIVACHATLHLPWLLHVDSNLDFLPGWKSALAYPSSSSSPDISLYARHSCGNESSRLGSRCFATRSYLSLSFLSLQGSLLYPTVSRLFSPETILGERFYGVQFLLSMAAIGSSLHTFVFYFWHHSSIVCSNTCLAST